MSLFDFASTKTVNARDFPGLADVDPADQFACAMALFLLKAQHRGMSLDPSNSQESDETFFTIAHQLSVVQAALVVWFAENPSSDEVDFVDAFEKVPTEQWYVRAPLNCLITQAFMFDLYSSYTRPTNPNLLRRTSRRSRRWFGGLGYQLRRVLP
jgi:hypothetical protein